MFLQNFPAALSGHFFTQVGTIRVLVSIVGKVCLFIACFLAFEIFDAVRASMERERELPTIGTAVPTPDSTEKQATSLSNYDVVVARNLLAVREAKTAPVAKQPEPMSALSLRLVATHVSERGNSFAIIESTKKKEQDIFDVQSNKSVFGEGTLVKILPESVEIQRGDRTERLVIEEAPSSSRGGPATASSAGPVNPDQTEFTVADAELTEALSNLPRLLSQARAVPYFKNGESVGMRLFAIREGSLYQKLGLRNGDIIKTVNNNSLTDPSQALKIFEQLKSERNINVLLERAGEEKTLEYAIR